MTLEAALAEFLTHLGLERNASDKTVKSYREDLTQALGFARERLAKGSVAPAEWNTRLLRAFVASLRGKLAGTKLDGVHFQEADEISIEGEDSSVILDGEGANPKIGRPPMGQESGRDRGLPCLARG